MFIYGVVLISELNVILLNLSGFLIVFCCLFFFSSNILMLYMFFELSMLPVLVMILGFGSQIEKISSSYYLLFYATFCSLPFLFIYFKSFFYLGYNFFDFFLSWEVFFVLSLSFMIKFPVYFLHLWLPKAHVEAPTTASMLLAGLLLKLGTSGFLRIMGSLNFLYVNFWIFLSLVGMVISSICCLFQRDIKSLAAYSSVTHMSFLLFSLSLLVMRTKISRLLMMLAHGYTSTLMFYFIGEFYYVRSSRMVYFFNSFLSSSIIFFILFLLVFLSNRAVPPSLSFLSEFVIIVNGFLFSKLVFFILLLYFMVVFYYSLFVIVCGSIGKNFVDFLIYKLGYSIPLVIIIFNVFWFSLIY